MNSIRETTLFRAPLATSLIFFRVVRRALRFSVLALSRNAHIVLAALSVPFAIFLLLRNPPRGSEALLARIKAVRGPTFSLLRLRARQALTSTRGRWRECVCVWGGGGALEGPRCRRGVVSLRV